TICLTFLLAASVTSARLDHLVPQGYAPAGAGAGSSNAQPYNYENVNNGDGTYPHESGSPRAQGPEGPAVTAEGGFSYRAPDGQQISLTYTADETGFHPVGAHLPTPPPIPEAILKSLEFNRQNPSS
ncbi:putative cuticle protein, partial [Operophtera brumata]